jgi:hypothetical protein
MVNAMVNAMVDAIALTGKTPATGLGPGIMYTVG